MSPSVLIVVLNWNGWRNTAQCLISLQALTYSRFDVVVVDNASSDDSVPMIKNLFPNIKVLQAEKNLGFGGGCNLGIRHALSTDADWVWLINNDATVDPSSLSGLVLLGLSDVNLGAIGSVIYETDSRDQVQVWGGGTVNFWLGRSTHRLSPGPIDFVSGASLLLRTQALTHVGLFDEACFFMYWEDTDLGFRLRNAGYKLGVATDSSVWHKQSASLGQGNPTLDYYFSRSAFRFFRKHGNWHWISNIILLLLLSTKRLIMGQRQRFSAIIKGYLNA